MSVEELIDLAKALPHADQLRLVQAVQEDRYTRMEREFAKTIPPGSVVEIWLPEISAESSAIVQQELRKLEQKKS